MFPCCESQFLMFRYFAFVNPLTFFFWGGGEGGGVKAYFFPAFGKTVKEAAHLLPHPSWWVREALSTRTFTDACFQNLCVRNTNVLSYIRNLVVKSKLPPRNGSSLEPTEPHL